MTEFLAMGRYAWFVWSSFALTALVLVVNWIWAKGYHRRQLARIARLVRRERSNS